jgi:hypothetical protein
MNISEKLLGKRVSGIYHNYVAQSLSLSLDDGLIVQFDKCAIVFDLGIIGHVITYVANTGTLGIVLELKRYKEDPESYNFLILSRDINDYEHKNEIVIAYKNVNCLEANDLKYTTLS